MLKKNVTYTDFNGIERTEDFYFHFYEHELAEMELSKTGGLSTAIQKAVAAKDQTAIIGIFKDIVLKAYGEKSEDGKRFVKSNEITTAFTQCPAYSIIFMELATNDEAAAEFVNNVIPNVK